MFIYVTLPEVVPIKNNIFYVIFFVYQFIVR